MTDAPTSRPRYLVLFAPFVAVIVLLAGWTVWWFVVAGKVEQGLDRGARDLRASGYQVSWKDRGVSGWPFRTFVRVRDLKIVAPTGHAIEMSELAAEAETYALGKWVFAAPKGLVFTRGPKGPVRIEGRAIRASVSGLGRAGAPNVAVQLLKPTFTPLEGAQPFPLASADKVELYLRPKAGAPGDGEALFRIEGGKGRPGGPVDWIAGGGPFNTYWETGLTRLRAARGSGWPALVRSWTAAGGALTGLHGQAKAGDAAAEAKSAQLTVGPDGRLRGTVDLSLTRGPEALLALGRSQAVNPGAAAAAGAVAAGKGGLNGTANMSLVFEDGGSRLGPVRLAPAPKVY
jgi:hypothetical protein